VPGTSSDLQVAGRPALPFGGGTRPQTGVREESGQVEGMLGSSP
jgi:hypothetical protein